MEQQVRSKRAQFATKVLFGVMALIIFSWTSYLTVSFTMMVMPNAFWMVPFLVLVLYDFGCLGWLAVTMFLAEGNVQRSVSIFMVFFNLLGVGLLSMAHIMLGGQQLAEVPTNLGEYALYAIGFSTIINAGAFVVFHLASPSARLAAAIQDEVDEVVDGALTRMKSRRSENSAALADEFGDVMYNTMLGVLTTAFYADVTKRQQRKHSTARPGPVLTEPEFEDLVPEPVAPNGNGATLSRPRKGRPGK